MPPVDSPASPSPGGRAGLLTAAVEYFAQHGIGDASLRHLAAAIGTSHRMLIYHFGSKDGLLAAVVAAIEEQQRDALAAMTADPDRSLREQAWDFWEQVADAAQHFGPLYFELASHAMRHRPHTEPLRTPNVEMWLDALTTLWERAGIAPGEAPVRARLNLAVSRGLLHDLLLTGDRQAVNEAMAMFDLLSFDSGETAPSVNALAQRWRR